MGQIENVQAAAEPISCIPEFAQLAAGQEHTIGVVATFNAPAIKDENQRLPIRLSAVLDKSGSMSGSKLDLVKATTKFMVQQLQEVDCLGIVSYDSSVSETFKFQSVHNSVKPEVERLINTIHAGSCTNLSGGLFKGLQQLQEWKEPDVARAANQKPVYCVFLFTDGQANEGITDADRLAAAVQANLANFGPTVRVHTFGFGNDHEPAFLRKISEASSGDYYYVQSQEEIPTAFADALGGILSVSAQNVEVTISAAGPDVTIVNVNTPFKTEKLADGSFKVLFGDLFSEERKDVLLTVKVKPVDPVDPAAPPPALVKISGHYLDVNTGTFCTRDTVLTIPRPAAVAAEASQPHPEVVSQRSRVESAAAMQAAMQAAEQGNMEAARTAIRRQVEALSAMPQDEAIRGYMEDLSEQAAAYRDESHFQALGNKKATSTMQAYSKQRRGTTQTRALASMARNNVIDRLVVASSTAVSGTVGAGSQPQPPPQPPAQPPVMQQQVGLEPQAVITAPSNIVRAPSNGDSNDRSTQNPLLSLFSWKKK